MLKTCFEDLKRDPRLLVRNLLFSNAFNKVLLNVRCGFERLKGQMRMLLKL